MTQDVSSLAFLKDLDHERYLACLYLPETSRDAIATLHAFDAEIALIPDRISDPMPGEIRLQWWRDLVKSGNNVGSGPLANNLVQILDVHNLPLETFQAYLDARIFDLYNDPMPDMGSFEGYLGETRAALYQMIALVAGLTRSSELADACGHTGMAIGLAQLIRQTGKHRAKHQLFFPETILQEAGLEADAWFADQINARHLRVLEEISQIAQSHYQQALGAIKQLPIESRAVFLPLTLVPKLLQKLRKSPESCLTQPLTLSRLTVHWTYLRSDKQFSR